MRPAAATKNVSWRSIKSAIRSHLSESWCHTVLFPRLCVNFAMASHSAANLRKRSAVFIATPGARTLLEAGTPIPLKGSGWGERKFWPKSSASNRGAVRTTYPKGANFGTGGGPILFEFFSQSTGTERMSGR